MASHVAPWAWGNFRSGGETTLAALCLWGMCSSYRQVDIRVEPGSQTAQNWGLVGGATQ